MTPHEPYFDYGNHPRDSVNWFDAIAFCRWLTAKANEHSHLLPVSLDRCCDWKITLPNEWQWEKAARGHDGRQYPWGDRYEEGRANVNEISIAAGPHYLRKTSAVGIYPHEQPEDSPYGVSDLAGNVWEWCLNEYANPERVQEEGNVWRVLRGGSWYFRRFAPATYRLKSYPLNRSRYFGLRVVAVGRALTV